MFFFSKKTFHSIRISQGTQPLCPGHGGNDQLLVLVENIFRCSEGIS